MTQEDEESEEGEWEHREEKLPSLQKIEKEF